MLDSHSHLALTSRLPNLLIGYFPTSHDLDIPKNDLITPFTYRQDSFTVYRVDSFMG